MLLSGEGVTQGYPLLMVLYGITLVPLVEDIWASDLGLISPVYADDAAFESSVRRSAQLLKLFMERGPDRGYLPNPKKFLFIADTQEQEEAAKREFATEDSEFTFLGRSWYLGAYLGSQEELEAWVKHQVEAWTDGVRTSGKIANRYPQSDYAILGMSLQLEWQYLQRNIPGVGTLMGPIEEVL